MDFPLQRAVGGKQAASEVSEPNTIRLLNWTAPSTSNRAFSEAEIKRLRSGKLFSGKWEPATPASAGAFSAVGWWAGLEIQRECSVPLGMIDCSVGGSGAEAWLPEEIIETEAVFRQLRAGRWEKSEKISAWARGRIAKNLAGRKAPHPYQPGILFDHGMRPWQGLPLTGILWYQGETNAEIADQGWNARLYSRLFRSWREQLGQPELPIVVVQLPRIGGNEAIRQHWPEFREMQAQVVSRLLHSALVKTSDLGWDSPDVHPPDKRPVGERVGKAAIELLRGRR